MTITKRFKSVSRRMVLVIVSLSVLSVALLAAVMYETNLIRFSGDVTSEELYSVVENNPEVMAYLETEKDYEAHFVTIASLIERDQQRDLGRSLLIATVPVILIAGAVGYLVARYVLRPVRESYESQERFLQDAAHELRNPLAAMSLAIENAKKSKTADKDFNRTMNRQTKRLIRVNEDLLYLERRTPGDPIGPVNISNLLEDVLEDLQPAIAHKKLQLIKRIQPNITMTIDHKDFIKMARNIIENAIKFSKSGKKLQVSLKQDKGIVFTVKDQGIGIAPEEIERIGERFFRARNASKVDGSGLGIAIVNKVLNVYGGNFEISSKEDVGTTVKITF